MTMWILNEISWPTCPNDVVVQTKHDNYLHDGKYSLQHRNSNRGKMISARSPAQSWNASNLKMQETLKTAPATALRQLSMWWQQIAKLHQMFANREWITFFQKKRFDFLSKKIANEFYTRSTNTKWCCETFAWLCKINFNLKFLSQNQEILTISNIFVTLFI